MEELQVRIRNIVDLVSLHQHVDDEDMKTEIKKAALSALKDLNKE